MFKAWQLSAAIEAVRGSSQIRARGCNLLNADL